MNFGPLIFLAAFLGMAGSWVGFVLTPQLQLGSLEATNKVGALTYPLARPGLAKAGLDVSGERLRLLSQPTNWPDRHGI